MDLLHQEYVFFENAEDIFGISGEVILREIEPYVLIDIDNFKLINDAYGHTVGDEIIQCVAHNLKNTFADSLIGRFGGDEFTVLVQNISHRDKLPEPRFYDRILMG
ncbi:MAG: GGDEF domain-containing protein [Enterocloster clostridioformis]|uniref:GGDEF domain-containing protein n=1 Tax=Enterocloster bolteae TaxID=208479 RepID=UPI002A950E5F|nr:GGDEF domain-containing protein [Enterocloster clostridioformis]